MKSHLFCSQPAPLTGRTGAAEGKLQPVFHPPKTRSILRAAALTTLVILLCGPLISCQSGRAVPVITMDIQYYDDWGNYIEIPSLSPAGGKTPDEGLQAVNQALAALKTEYQPVLDGTCTCPWENQCLLYPTVAGPYINLVFYRQEFVTDLNSGHVLSLVYDFQRGRQVTLQEALDLAGTTRQALYDSLSAQINPTLSHNVPASIQNPVLEAFRMREEGGPIFYLTARIDDADPDMDNVSGAEHIFLWQEGVFTLYDQYAVPLPQPLVPAEEVEPLSPPLWCQWYFDGGEPEGGFTTPSPVWVRPGQAPEVSMQLQYYDISCNIEVPALAAPQGREDNEDLKRINAELAQLADRYRALIGDPDGLEGVFRCLCYPSTTDRYVNLILYEQYSDFYDLSFSVSSWVYDCEEERRLTLEDALALAGTDREQVTRGLNQAFDDGAIMYFEPGCFMSTDPTHNPIDPQISAFRIRPDGQVEFYLTAWIYNGEEEALYLCSQGRYTFYAPLSQGGMWDSLVPAEELDPSDPPLWCRWFFNGGDYRDQPSHGI